LFASNRLVVITDLSEHKLLAEAFEKLASRVSEDVNIVLIETALDKRTVFYKTLKKFAELEEFAEMDEVAAVKWVRELAQLEGVNVSPSSARLLVQYVGPDQLRLENEVAKLTAYDDDITAEAIELLVEKKPQDTIFQLLEYALS